MKLGGLIAATLWCAGCGIVDAQQPAQAASSAGLPVGELRGAAIVPLPRGQQLDTRKVAVGERLYTDTRLSGDGLVSCQSCHALGKGGANGESRSNLPGRPPVPVNVPSVFNVAYDFRYAWNGRYERLEDQLDFAMTAAAAMAGTWARAVQAVAPDSSYMAAFADAYPEGLTERSMRDALVAYCRSLTTPDSRFDQYLRGEGTLGEHEQRGYEAFRAYGCISCHQGQNVGGNMYQRFGVMFDYFADRGDLRPADLGRYNATHLERDRYMFRVPSLRNVEKTAPYFHDGSAKTLEEAVTTMARYQLGRELTAPQASEIAAFLRTLTGKYRGEPL